MTILSRPFPPLLRSVCAAVLLSTCSWYAQAQTAAPATPDTSALTELLRTQQHEKALVELDKLLKQNPQGPQLRFLLGVAQAMANKNNEAIETFTKLTQEYPELPEPYNNLAVLYANQNQLAKSRETLERAIRTNPSYATAHENLGDIYAKLASQAYSKALQLDANHTASVQPKLALIHELFSVSQNNAQLLAQGQAPRTQVAAATPTTPRAPVGTASSAATATSTVSPATPTATEPVVAATPALAPATTDTRTAAAAAASTTSAAPAVAQASADSSSNKPSTSSAAEKAVQTAVQAWAKAWAAQDMGAYLGAYSPNFQPAGKQSRKAWERERRERIVGKRSISVQLSDLTIDVQKGQATAKFQQAYKANNFQSNSRKTLTLEERNGKWLIVRETVGG